MVGWDATAEKYSQNISAVFDESWRHSSLVVKEGGKTT